MKTVSIEVRDATTSLIIPIGKRGENNATEVIFDIQYLIDAYGDGNATLMARRTSDTAAYPVTVERNGQTVTWTTNNVDTAFEGLGKCELFWYVGDILAKSIVYTTITGPDIGEATGDPPDPYETWLETLAELGEETLENSLSSEGFALGKQNGEDVPSGSTYYHNNAKYFCEQAEKAASVFVIDNTLTQPGQAADAKVAGDNVRELHNGKTDGRVTKTASGTSFSVKSTLSDQLSSLSVEEPCTINVHGTNRMKPIPIARGTTGIYNQNVGATLPHGGTSTTYYSTDGSSVLVKPGSTNWSMVVFTTDPLPAGKYRLAIKNQRTENTASQTTYCRSNYATDVNYKITSVVSNSQSASINGTQYWTVTVPENGRICSAVGNAGSGTAFGELLFYFSVNKGTTALPFEKYETPQTYVISDVSDVDPTQITMYDHTTVFESTEEIEISYFCDINEVLAEKASADNVEDIESNVETMQNDIYLLKDKNDFVDSLVYRNILPDYYFGLETSPQSYADSDEYLETIIKNVPKGKHFIFVTDVHWPTNAKKTNQVIQYVRGRLGIEKVLFGGDVLNRSTDKYKAKQVLCSYLNESVSGFGKDFLPAWGNHDLNTANSPDLATERMDVGVSADLFTQHLNGTAVFEENHNYGSKTGTVEEVITEIVQDKIADSPTVLETLGMTQDEVVEALLKYNHLHYYVDDYTNKTRYIIYNTGCPDNNIVRTFLGVSDLPETYLQVLWFYNVLMSTPTNYDIVVCAHEAMYKSDLNENLVSSFYMRGIFSQLSGIKLKTSITIWVDTDFTSIPAKWIGTGNHTLNFSNAPDVGKILLLTGHWHFDFAGKGTFTSSTYNTSNYSASIISNEVTVNETSGEVLAVCSRCDRQPDSTYDNTVNEQAFDIVTITDDNKIVLDRVGYSSSNTARRQFTIT